MRCPIEKSDMIVVEHENIELDYCLKCKGVWFDAGELELLISMLKSKGTELAKPEFLAPKDAKTAEAKRKCPICGLKMDKVWAGGTPKVLIDRCPRGDGIWFDGGELHEVLCQMDNSHKELSKDIVTFLQNTFKADCQ
jgi:Zn-finger nucleic acid-binding protein